ncbi:hypothetical protein IWQ60_008273 [Tieghemiomyces parasiticus]|uniref:Uncharacterized protein n=1 Tax=Tieghemiomyces parasiticus TaxID=78921 RepID=A0A9W8DNE7_9FUNG|nr:hypothetical protein IWQ60_008273 [Tieghemiomyces parasiticus]
MSLGRSASCRLPHATSSEDCLASLAPAGNATTSRRPALNHHGAKPTRRAGIPPCLRLPSDGALSDPEDTVSPTTAVARPSISSIHTLGITAGTARPQSFHAFARRRSSGVFKATVSGSTGAVSAVFQVHGAAQFSHPATRRTSPIEILRPLQDSTPVMPRPPPCGGSNISTESCSTLSSDGSTASSLLETDAAHLDGAVEAFAPAHGTLSGGNRRALRSPNAAVASLALLAGIPTKALPCTAAITPPDEIAADHTLLDSPLVLSKDASTYTSFPSLVDYSLAGCASDAAVVTCKATKPLMSHLTENSVVRMLQSGTKHHSSIMLN